MTALSLYSRIPNQRVSDYVHVEGSPVTLTAPRLTILIHGYNNSIEKAERSFQAFEDLVDRTAQRPNALGSLVPLFWPGGDTRNSLLIGSAAYAVRVPEAVACGERLAEFLLARIQPYQRVTMIAHSLGCRLALEALRQIIDVKRANPNWLSAVVLLAAAVPEEMCKADGLMFRRWTTGHREIVFYSRRDLVLRAGFMPGQRMAGELGRAVGRTGGPRDRWLTTVQTKHGHGDYWSSTAVAEHLAARVAVGPRRMAMSDLERRELVRRRIVPPG